MSIIPGHKKLTGCSKLQMLSEVAEERFHEDLVLPLPLSTANSAGHLIRPPNYGVKTKNDVTAARCDPGDLCDSVQRKAYCARNELHRSRRWLQRSQDVLASCQSSNRVKLCSAQFESTLSCSPVLAVYKMTYVVCWPLAFCCQLASGVI